MLDVSIRTSDDRRRIDDWSLVLTALDVLVLFALVGFEFSTTALVCAGLLLPVAVIWNLRMLNLIEER